jgi:hypothetical protein
VADRGRDNRTDRGRLVVYAQIDSSRQMYKARVVNGTKVFQRYYTKQCSKRVKVPVKNKSDFTLNYLYGLTGIKSSFSTLMAPPPPLSLSLPLSAATHNFCPSPSPAGLLSFSLWECAEVGVCSPNSSF